MNIYSKRKEASLKNIINNEKISLSQDEKDYVENYILKEIFTREINQWENKDHYLYIYTILLHYYGDYMNKNNTKEKNILYMINNLYNAIKPELDKNHEEVIFKFDLNISEDLIDNYEILEGAASVFGKLTDIENITQLYKFLNDYKFNKNNKKYLNTKEGEKFVLEEMDTLFEIDFNQPVFEVYIQNKVLSFSLNDFTRFLTQ